MGGRFLRAQLNLLGKQPKGRKTLGGRRVRSGHTASRRGDCDSSLCRSTGCVVAVYRKTFQGMCGSCLPVNREFDVSSKSAVTHKPALAAGPVDRSRYIRFERHDGGWVKTYRCHDGGQISLNVCLVSRFLFRTEPRTTMSSDSEDDSDYEPTAPQNDGLYPYF